MSADVAVLVLLSEADRRDSAGGKMGICADLAAVCRENLTEDGFTEMHGLALMPFVESRICSG